MPETTKYYAVVFTPSIEMFENRLNDLRDGGYEILESETIKKYEDIYFFAVMVYKSA